MNILITAERTDLFGGQEMFVRDLALGLERRGHAAVVWNEGSVRRARPAEADGVRVCRDLRDIPFIPDILHAQTHMDTMTALTWFPTMPAIYHAHGAGWKGGAAPKHPRIYRYAAVSPAIAWRLVVELGIGESSTDVVLNSIDLSQFREVRVPPRRPSRALFYNSYHGPESRLLAAIREAAGIGGLELDCIGRRLGATIDHPQDVLTRYDVVFASGRSAIDALACGCAVVTIGMTSCGELVRPDNFDRWRRANFAVGVNAAPPTPRRIRGELDRYAADDCAKVTRRLRDEADSMRMIVHMEAIYAAVMRMHAAASRDHQAELRTIARYLRRIAPGVAMIDEQRTAGNIPLTQSRGWRSASRQLAPAG